MATVSWINAAGGSWTTAADWSTGMVPGPTDDAVIGIAGFYGVSLTATAVTVNSLTVNDPYATLAIAAPGDTESITGNLVNGGTITVDAGTMGGTTLSLGGSLTNTGNLSLSGLAQLKGHFFSNKGIFGLDNAVGDAGGGMVKVGAVSNQGDIELGGTGLTSAVTMTATALGNSVNGTIHLLGSSTAKTSLIVSGAVQSTWRGFLDLGGNNDLVQFGSGGITSLGTNSQIFLGGPNSQVDIAGVTGNNTALTGFASNYGQFFLVDGATLTTNVALANVRSLFVEGGSTLTIGGTLTNTGSVTIASNYNGGTNRETEITALGLSSTGFIGLTGSFAQTTLNIVGAAPTTLTGNWQLNGDALIEFGGTAGIATIAAGSVLQLDELRARVALSSDPTSNSALAGLATNFGSFNLNDGASVTTNVGFTNNNFVGIDNNTGSIFNGDGGSSFAIGGVLANNGTFNIGNGNLLTPTTVTATGLANFGTIRITGGNGAEAELAIAAAAPATWTGAIFLTGGAFPLPGEVDALLDYSSGAITAIGQGATLSLNGAAAQVNVATTATGNSALATLASNAGSFSLNGGASLTTTSGVNFTNSGSLTIDSAFNASGSKLALGGTLSNNNFASIAIGNTGNGSGTEGMLSAAALTNSGLIQLLSGSTAGGMLSIAGNAGNSGAIDVDFNEFGFGGSQVSIGGMLSNSGFINIGNFGLMRATNVTVGQLANTGNINLTGNLSGGAAMLTVMSAAPATLTGNINLNGKAFLVYASGAITAIGQGASLTLNDAAAQADITGVAGSNSALKVLNGNAGSLFLANGAVVGTTPGGGTFANSGFLGLDNFGTGGSTFTVNGSGTKLSNSGTINIGNAGITATAKLSVVGLTNNGNINIIGGSAQALLSVGSAAPATLTGRFNLNGNAKLLYAGTAGFITGIASNANLNLGSSLAQVDNAVVGNNSALTKLASNSGGFSLNGGASLTTASGVNFTNSGSLAIDNAFNASGSSLALGGTLSNNNSANITIGNTGNGSGTEGTLSAAALSNSGFIQLFSGNTAGGVISIAGNAGNSGGLNVDFNEFGFGGSQVSIGGMLSNGNSIAIGNSGLTRNTSVTVGQLANSGGITLIGNPNGGQAQLIVNAAAPSTLGGGFFLNGNALVDYASGAITAISGSLQLNGSAAQVDIGTTAGNSALSTLAGISGFSSTFILQNGASLTTTPGGGTFANSGFLEVDNGGGGGSTLNIAGTLDSSNFVQIGNAGIGAATNVGAAALAVKGNLNLAGGFASATLNIAGNASNDGGFVNVDTNSFNGSGGAVLTIGGTLTNTNLINIGNSRLGRKTSVTAAVLANNANGGSANLNLTGGTAAATLTITGNASNTQSGFSGAFINIDGFGGDGGGAMFSVGGSLSNGGTVNIGNSGLVRATTATVGSLANTGTINLAGAAAVLAELKVAATAPATLTGHVNLSGDALLQYGGTGFIGTIGGGSSLSLSGALASVGLAGVAGLNAALKGLSSNAGTLDLEGGAKVATATNLSNSGTLHVDFNAGSGGSSLTLAGALNNTGTGIVDIFDSKPGGTSNVKAAGLTNAAGGSVNVSGNGSGGTATLTLTAASSDAGTLILGNNGSLALGTTTLTTTGSLLLQGGTIGGTGTTGGGKLAGTGTITASSGNSTLNDVTIVSGTTVGASSGATLTLDNVTVSGAITGSGSTLIFGLAGSDPMTNISGFSTIDLANGGANTLTLAAGNFSGTSGITINDGDSGNTVSAAGQSNPITVHAGAGADNLTGGGGNDVFFAGGNTTMTGNAGTNQFTFADIGANTISDFSAAPTNELAFSDAGFNLGLSGASSTPTPLPGTLIGSLSDGTFSNTTQRFAYNQGNGQLLFSADGSGSTASVVATLTSDPTVSASQLFYVT